MNILVHIWKDIWQKHKFKNPLSYFIFMKIFAFTDVHGSEHLIQEVIKTIKSKKPELIICPGDLTIFGHDLEKILSKFDKLKISCLVVHGNHESDDELKDACKKFKNIIYLHRGVLEKGDYAFFGYGGDGFSTKDEKFEKISEIVGKKTKGKNLIMITHQPPHGNKLDYLEYFEHVGNKSYTKFIKKWKPVMSIFGHLHEHFGKMDHINKKTILINPGPLGKLIEI